MKEVIIEKRNVWGKVNMYVISDNAAAIAQLTGKKTVDEYDIKALVELGLDVKTITHPL